MPDESPTFTRFIYRPRWFVLAQTEGGDVAADAPATWNQSAALARLNPTLPPQALDEAARRWTEVPPIERVRDQASRLLRVHPLRAADALQLAAALVLLPSLGLRAQVIPFESGGLKYQTLSKQGVTVMFAQLPGTLHDYAIIQAGITTPGALRMAVTNSLVDQGPEPNIWRTSSGFHMLRKPTGPR